VCIRDKRLDLCWWDHTCDDDDDDDDDDDEDDEDNDDEDDDSEETRTDTRVCFLGTRDNFWSFRRL